MRPFTIQRIDHVVLRVSDLARSVAFYRDLLGCQVSRQRDDLGMIHLAAGTAMIDLVALDGPLGRRGGRAAAREGRNVDHFCLRIEPFDEAALVGYLNAAGVVVEPAEKRYGAEGEGLSLYCFDPDGNQVELKGPSAGP
ncbi:VOC family protein [Pseudomonas guariconensis]|uniref:VOC family protein n=1 Tax=Pseudomonas TaxID=286 RepID=UPI001CE41E51|nr:MULTISPECIES: VOC family protein [Pseudomonas]MCO7638628.1 VOC family protein [Pseudomonas sp. S 311-6]MCO7513887.1 VOC family protein [Pseudomonas putida]MCO7565930.1 VOC family protein [Pseudomonas mosselii]MCO7595587.1 VOC family protein [Pseudomonas guariconensis]MCO7605310.1 VOC family protein [Pseudomonas guariconensis]